MAKTINFPISENFNMQDAVALLKTHLQAQGYEVEAYPMGEAGASINVSKDNDGIKKLSGLGVECTVSLTVINKSIVANIESVWTNKIIAICVGWFLCLIPAITGIIGCINQSELPKKITTVIHASFTSM